MQFKKVDKTKGEHFIMVWHVHWQAEVQLWTPWRVYKRECVAIIANGRAETALCLEEKVMHF